ncbi:hypothetical protein QMG61_15220 [Cryobacterium sp. PH31-AA6]|uniref:hypothetical protein n=1 Tax=Cryobacterium sp. PH31-AA6 TaxID=3046205 RepID=UPI0024B89FEF|nr:hypothetical protein [Cryobacterium sp. PH31-AA6]MDJ0325115.1 hypothetical protein [Cryobacterium sp. PH31-AA6]
MTEKKNPQAANQGAEVKPGRSGSISILADDSAPIPETPKIGATVEGPLSAALVRLLADEITLDDCTPALAAWFLEGHRAALASVLPELTRAEQSAEHANADADRLYGLAFTPREPLKVGPSYAEIQKIRAETYRGTR